MIGISHIEYTRAAVYIWEGQEVHEGESASLNPLPAPCTPMFDDSDEEVGPSRDNPTH